MNGLPNWVKGTILILLLGVGVTTGLYIYAQKQTEAATKLENEANRLRGEATAALEARDVYKSQAEQLKKDLRASLVNSAKIQKELDALKVPPPVGPAPAYVSDIVADLNKMGLHPLVGASNTVGRSAFGIRKDETQILWTWAMQSVRVEGLEVIITKQKDLIESTKNDLSISTKLVDLKTKEADMASKAADKFMKEADTRKVEVEAIKKAMSAERRKKILYGVGGVIAGALTTKALTR